MVVKAYRISAAVCDGARAESEEPSIVRMSLWSLKYSSNRMEEAAERCAFDDDRRLEQGVVGNWWYLPRWKPTVLYRLVGIKSSLKKVSLSNRPPKSPTLRRCRSLHIDAV